MQVEIRGTEDAASSSLWDGLVAVAVTTVLVGLALLLQFRGDSDYFTQPPTWVRILLTAIAGVLAGALWAWRFRGRRRLEGGAVGLVLGVPMLVAVVLYLATALYAIEQRKDPLPIALPDEIAGQPRLDLGPRLEKAFQARLGTADPKAFGGGDASIRYALYAGPDFPAGRFSFVAVATAAPGSSLAHDHADDYDSDIVDRVLDRMDATDLSESRTISDSPGRFRCGKVRTDGETVTACLYVHSVQAVVIVQAGQTDGADGASEILNAMIGH